MATSRRLTLLAALALTVAGCGGAATRAPSSAARPAGATLSARSGGSASPFSWLVAAPAPAGWKTVRLASGATLAYPPGWHPARGDRGTATAELVQAGGTLVGYLNLTPRQGGETEANWTRFRPTHNAREGDSHVTVLEAARGLSFRRASGACVRDRYATRTGARYVEIACLVTGAGPSEVIVGAAPTAVWARQAPAIERAISALSL